MAAMVIKTPQFSLPTSNGHTVNETEELEKTPASVPQFHIDVGELQKSCNDACNQLTPRKARAAAEIPKNIFSSFKTALMFGANGPDAQETPRGKHDDSGVRIAIGNNGIHLQEDQNTGPDPSHSSACNRINEADSQEQSEFPAVPELHELADAFPPTCGQLPHAQGAEAQNNPPASGSTNHAAASMAKSPSRPSSPYTVGQEVHINDMPRNSVQGIPGDDVVTLINTRSASFQSTKGEYHQHQEQHTVLNPHSQSQFLLTISTPSQSGYYESGDAALSYQYLSNHLSEAPSQMASKDGCQLPDCVTRRASGIVAVGGAQLEHLLARVKHEKTLSRARAWEEGAKAKVYNRYARDESKITAWENTMKAKAEAKMRKAQENLDKKRAKYIEKMKNDVARAHCKAQEKRAAMEASRAEEIVKAEEISSRIRATGKMPRKFLCIPA
ncbi:uncharacterized protein [Physcomitrium patens]|uniref:Remorin C-terminal domain-containing protein n=1 Tax=Physcomitrium patens TaxID=3218 RepID=A0A2K1JPE6_PHYPA|nr:uncharacterized protein LOC112289418 [Physcomitrium patens]XP_024390379.1 uncharacterized protein LOC112289418 [Physcomitrium patens]PNR43419.1 hypothetical protein PHYPA_015800 [Physcomitrium patens]|eukprot:XP_024390378.1 uncharacterized protein LOC112289418 [Physcomitrella patens]